MIIGVLLLLAFIRGFRTGFWRSVFNLAGTLAAFLGAYALSGPTVDFLNKQWGLFEKTSVWWERVFETLPPLLVPYNPATFDQAFSSIGGSQWGRLLQGAVKQNLVAVGPLASPNPTWAEMLGLALTRLFLSSIAFLVLFSLLRLVAEMIVRSLGFTAPDSLVVRFLGGLVETGLSVVWLSLLAGALYPFLTAGFLGGAREQASSSYLMALLTTVYQTLWPAVIARVKL
ncbi:MAG: CvpA family protein [Bacillota bacterium]|nr:CvpA family protein [Candidatus Fermentithermobacillaceae bacterium]